ncbi:MAG: LD-carboxypeptidase [Sphingomonadales bacterium]|nr:LD-carboxypeptidase [Sphingomonadales bacterium]
MLVKKRPAMGLVPKRANLLKRYGYLAGAGQGTGGGYQCDVRRRDVKAIFAVRGGWGAARAAPLLDWDVVRSNPKLLIGYSDITALHMAIAAKGGAVTMLHGPNANSPLWSRGLDRGVQGAGL